MDPTQGQPNPGSFMAPAGQPGQGSALMRLMALRQQGATPQAGATPLPAAPVQTGSPINQRQMIDATSMGQQSPPPVQMPAGGGSMAGNPPQTTFSGQDPNLQIALGALANFTKAHGEKIMAESGVHDAKARAKILESQANPPAAPVGN